MKSSRTFGIRRMSAARILLLIVSCLCVIFGAIVLMNLQTPRRVFGDRSVVHEPILLSHRAQVATLNTPSPAVTPSQPAAAPSSSVAPASSNVALSDTTGDLEADLVNLKAKRLLIPVAGVNAGNLRDTFSDPRSEGRIHQALDIMAPSGTPVVAVADGKATRLHTSARGGLMLYESDLSSPYVYCYGHLQRYADGVYEGKELKRGEVIAYVGDTGNAGAGNYHLHFGISRMLTPGKWSGGEPINPYPLLSGE